MDPPTAAPPRRKPGRPPNKPASSGVPFNGIVDSPLDANNILEFVTIYPTHFKSLFSYFKNIKSQDIRVCFRKTEITFLTKDHTRTSRIITIVNCRYVNWYYCAQDVSVWLDRENAEKLFLNIDKSYSKFTIEMHADDPGGIFFILRDPDRSKEAQYRVPVMVASETMDPMDADLANIEDQLGDEGDAAMFPLQFTMTSKEFKKTVSDASSYSTKITIEKQIDAALNLKYDSDNIAYNELYLNDQTIRLICNVDYFECTIKIANVKSLASSIVTDNVTIMCGKDEFVLLRCDIDAKSMVVYTFIPKHRED
jgi:hypothetical protein